MADDPETPDLKPKRKLSETPEAEDITAKRLKVASPNAHIARNESINDGNTNGAPGDVSRTEVSATSHGKSSPVRASSRSPQCNPERDAKTATRRSPAPEQRGPPRRSANRASFRAEEKNRGRRMFGGLLNTLNQNKPSTQQVRREEVERRQHERAQQQQVEVAERRAKKLAEMKRLRKIEQIRFEEQVIYTRQRDLLAQAEVFRTRAEPAIYYCPYVLTDQQDDQIKAQVAETKRKMAKEWEEFKIRETHELEKLGAFVHKSGETSTDQTMTAGEGEEIPGEIGDEEMEEDKEDAVLY